MELLKEKGSSFAPVAELAMGCRLRLSEIAGLKGKDIDKGAWPAAYGGMGGKS